jgi:outer membrane beta-barrel protein
MKKHLAIFAALILFVFSAQHAAAQVDTSDESQTDINQIEVEIEKNVHKDNVNPSTNLAPPSAQNTTGVPISDEKQTDVKINDISDLATLAPFSDVSVIQKKFLPKTDRFQLFGGLTSMMNDPWFTNLGLSAKLGYFFTEQWGVELDGLFLSTTARDNIKALQNNDQVSTSSIITVKGYYGASVVWAPIYGKMGMFGKKIIPFDMYFALGGGSSQIKNGSGGTTLHAATGQIFSISKSLGFRWDLTWNMVQATPAGQGSQNFNNILLAAGFSYFFPDAGYR